MTLIGLTTGLFAQKDISGTYRAPWGSKLTLKTNKTFDYESFECHHLVTATGDWKFTKDTLRLTTTNKAGYDSIINIEYSNTDFDGIRITLTDKDTNTAYFVPVMAFNNGDTIGKNTGTLGYVDFNLSTIDSVQIGRNSAIKLTAGKNEQNHITISFLNINILDTENFNNRPYLFRGKKLYLIFDEGINKKKYFKKE